jgi:hypothetical protein
MFEAEEQRRAALMRAKELLQQLGSCLQSVTDSADTVRCESF